MNFKDDLRAHAVARLTGMGVQFSAAGTLEELLIAVLTVEERQIVAQPRSVHTSPSFGPAIAGLTSDEQAGVREVMRKFEVGEDVNAHLNRFSVNPSKDDDLLTDWGIWHFHLGVNLIPGTAFVERTGPLAFAHVTPTDAFFIDLLPHGSFAQPKLVENLLRAFPVVAAAHEYKGVAGTAFPTPSTESEVKLLRKVHVNAPITVDGKVYFAPGGGFVSSGASGRVIMRMMRTIREVEYLERMARENLDKMNQAVVAQRPGTDPATFRFTLFSTGNAWIVREESTQVGINFVPDGKGG